MLYHNKHLAYVDGFAGQGRFDTGEEGSPLLVLKKASDILKKRQNRRFSAYFIEKEKVNCEKLIKEIDSLNLPSNIEHHVINVKFEIFFQGIKESYDAALKTIPIFFFLDPFGYSPIGLDDLKFILSLEKSEFFLTFMYRDLNRFIKTEHLKETRKKVLGIDDFSNILSTVKTPIERENAIVSFYRMQLSGYVKARFSSFFCVKSQSNFRAPTLYYLIHATNNFKGFKVMKEVMFSIGGENYAYYGSLKKTTLEEMLETYKEKIEDYLTNKYIKDKWYDYEHLLTDICIDTPYIEKHCREILKKLEKENKIVVKRLISKKTGIKEGDLIMFC